ncbi:MAG: M14 metallopeptidase family protein, partial [Bacteroidota bacterium]
MTPNPRKTIRRLCRLLVLFSICAIIARAQPSQIPTPSQFLGFDVGADRKLADYKQITSYFKMLASSSKRIEIEVLGPTTLGNDMFMAVISSEDNLKNKKKYQEIARMLADPRGLSQIEIDNLVKQGKAIVLVTCNIHASEIGATQMAMEWAHALVTAQDEVTKRRLDNVILLLVPSLNPDGQIMEVEWYRKYLGTPYEGGRMPWLYHHYIGHDNNRDWYMLTQKETKALNRAVFFEWFPQIWLDEHQMGSTGPRMFVPPYSNPVAQNIHPLVWRAVDHIGSMMSWRLEEQKKSGVIYGYVFDAYWPGGTKNTAWWKNVVGLLTEGASVRLATPIEVSSSELSGGGKGLVEYKQQTNFPNPWPGGTWHLRDIMDYERIASDALLEVCANHREDFLRAMTTMAMDALKLGTLGEYFKISMAQRDPATAARLAHLIRENGAEVLFSSSDKTFYIPTVQPYSRFLSEFLGIQRYPKVKLTSGPNIVPPYDMTAWSLPLMMGVEVEKENVSSERQASLRPVKDTDWPEGSIDRIGAPTYAVTHESNNVTRLMNDVLKRKGGVSIAKTGFEADGVSYPAGTVLIESAGDLASLAQQYSLRLRGLSARPDVHTYKLHEARIGLYKPWAASMDEGWTRWVLEQYNFTYKNMDNKEIKAGKLSTDYDVILLPDVSKEVIVEGKSKREEGEMKYFPELPAEYSGGIGKDGAKILKE